MHKHNTIYIYVVYFYIYNFKTKGNSSEISENYIYSNVQNVHLNFMIDLINYMFSEPLLRNSLVNIYKAILF